MIVVKFGGHAMRDEDGSFAEAIGNALQSGEKAIVVHGGGPQIDTALAKAGISSQFIGGLRVTTPEVFAIVEEVLARQVGPAIAVNLRAAGIAAKALSGRDGGILIAKKLTSLVNGEKMDLGLVGEVTAVNPAPLLQLLAQGITPVLSPIARLENSVTGLNVNADLAAGAIAGAVKARTLIVLTDVAGIYRSWPDKSSLINQISATDLEAIKGNFTEGMAPKVQAALDAIARGTKAVRIIDGTDSVSFAKALSDEGGTLVYA